MVYQTGPRGEHVVVVDNKQGIAHVTVGKFTMVFPRHRKLFLIQGHVQVSTLQNNDLSYIQIHLTIISTIFLFPFLFKTTDRLRRPNVYLYYTLFWPQKNLFKLRNILFYFFLFVKWQSKVVAPPVFHYNDYILLNWFASWIWRKYQSLNVKQPAINQSTNITRKPLFRNLRENFTSVIYRKTLFLYFTG